MDKLDTDGYGFELRTIFEELKGEGNDITTDGIFAMYHKYLEESKDFLGGKINEKTSKAAVFVANSYFAFAGYEGKMTLEESEEVAKGGFDVSSETQYLHDLQLYAGRAMKYVKDKSSVTK